MTVFEGNGEIISKPHITSTEINQLFIHYLLQNRNIKKYNEENHQGLLCLTC